MFGAGCRLHFCRDRRCLMLCGGKHFLLYSAACTHSDARLSTEHFLGKLVLGDISCLGIVGCKKK